MFYLIKGRYIEVVNSILDTLCWTGYVSVNFFNFLLSAFSFNFSILFIFIYLFIYFCMSLTLIVSCADVSSITYCLYASLALYFGKSIKDLKSMLLSCCILVILQKNHKRFEL